MCSVQLRSSSSEICSCSEVRLRFVFVSYYGGGLVAGLKIVKKFLANVELLTAEFELNFKVQFTTLLQRL
jgi:hypothetical protein